MAASLTGCGRLNLSAPFGWSGNSAGQRLSPRIIAPGQPVPKGGGRYKLGPSYAVDGKRFVPAEDPYYDAVGTASWYGALFHGRETANGEIYDMNALTGAHPTLPLPVYARVTNLHNRRSLILRINDRGPFRKRRVVDVSRRAAELLGFKRQGTVPVRVTYLGPAPLNGDDRLERRYLAHQDWARGARMIASREERAPRIRTARLNPPFYGALDRARWRAVQEPYVQRRRPPQAAPVRRARARPVDQTGASPQRRTIRPPVSAVLARKAAPENEAHHPRGESFFVQAGAFSVRANAERVRDRFPAIVPVRIKAGQMGGHALHMVSIGPFKRLHTAKLALKVAVQVGVTDAWIIRR